MSRLEELIEELCPEGVDIRELKEILKIKNGRDYKKFEAGDIPVYGSGGIIAYVNRFAYDKPSVLIPRKGSIDKLYYVDTPFWNVDTIFYTEINIALADPKYVYYCLQMMHLEDLNTAGGVPSLTQKVLNRVLIPVPPLPVQQEIVRILDNFTNLTAELTAELTARKKQYEYYRDELINCEKCNFVRLGSICKVITKGTTPKQFTSEGISFIKTESFVGSRIDKKRLSFVSEDTHHGFLKRSILEANDILITIAGATIGKCAMVSEDILPANTNQALAIIRLNNEANKSFVLYVFQSNYMKNYIKKKIKGSAQPNLTLKLLNKFEIPLPPLEEQERIVELLDRFDTLCNDITTGLPAEIVARRKQYEYYRDKLLTFKELA